MPVVTPAAPGGRAGLFVTEMMHRKAETRMLGKESLSALDPRSPMVLDTSELGRRPGAMREVRRTISAPDALGTEVIGIPTGADIHLDLRLEAVMEGVLVSGTARARAVGECVRCLDEVTLDLAVDIQELFVYPGRARSAEDEEPQVQGDLIDLEPLLRDSIVPTLPFQPHCSPDCPGLCSECGARLADDPGHAHDLVDPRWAALRTLTGGSETGPEKES